MAVAELLRDGTDLVVTLHRRAANGSSRRLSRGSRATPQLLPATITCLAQLFERAGGWKLIVSGTSVSCEMLCRSFRWKCCALSAGPLRTSHACQARPLEEAHRELNTLASAHSAQEDELLPKEVTLFDACLRGTKPATVTRSAQAWSSQCFVPQNPRRCVPCLPPSSAACTTSAVSRVCYCHR